MDSVPLSFCLLRNKQTVVALIGSGNYFAVTWCLCMTKMGCIRNCILLAFPLSSGICTILLVSQYYFYVIFTVEANLYFRNDCGSVGRDVGREEN
jgi:hypothetical protein